MKKSVHLFISLTLLVLGFSCSDSKENDLFLLKDLETIGMSFQNDLSFDQKFNVYTYRNYYNGGGVSLGDINNDGLTDVYLTSNQKQNKLFLNQGNFKFKDITEQAGVGGTKAWSTGVTMVDINSDGFLDIYVCNSGDVEGDNKQNEFFINNGDLTFTESAEQYNLADKGFSTHASFFDYDKDGDLDVYLLNNSYQAIGSFDLRRNERPKRDEKGGDKLMQNNNGVFTDVSVSAGIYGSVIGFGLGVSVGDINGDAWEDIFVSNDFFERDYLYINQKDGTFKEDLTSQMRSISGASMGADMADLNNDGSNDIFVTEMLPSDYKRLKTVTTFEDWNKYQYVVKNGYHHQFTRNMLHLNNDNGTFSEIGRFTGVEASDWSWGALFFDMDNDGYKDLFIANGIYQDLTNQDYLQYVANEEVMKSMIVDQKVDYKRLIEIIPSNKVPNHSYKNLGNLEFESFSASGLNVPSFSNGSAYGDLDNDGDLDLIVNNVNMPLFVFENRAERLNNNFLKFDLKGSKNNKLAVGSIIKVITPEKTIHQEVQPVRGFQSSMESMPLVGLGKSKIVDVEITWPSGKTSFFNNIETNQTLVATEEEAELKEVLTVDEYSLFKIKEQENTYVHKESNFVDFHRDRLIYHMTSTQGPHIGYEDLDNDGFNDLIIPGSKNNEVVFSKGTSSGFSPYEAIKDLNHQAKLKSSDYSDIAVFDADGDSDLDIYLASGGVEISAFSSFLYDDLLLNDGQGNFTKTNQQLPSVEARINSGVVEHADIDGDGDQDLFVGERSKVATYGLPGSGYLLVNDGTGVFEDQTATLAKELKDVGLITDALFVDLDQDNDQDLIVVGEFMSVTIFENTPEGFIINKNHALANKKGWWNTIHGADIDGDGDLDFILGNHGTNSRFRASDEFPIRMYLNDFDLNGAKEGVLTFKAENGKFYPFALRHNLIDQMKSLKKKFPDFESFKDADIDVIFSKEQMKGVQITEVNTLETQLWINNGNFSFTPIELPNHVQFSPVYAINTADFDQDGDLDIVMGGNLYNSKPEVGIYDASYGVYLENKGDLNFEFHTDGKGFSLPGQIRSIAIDNNQMIVARNRDSLKIYTWNK